MRQLGWSNPNLQGPVVAKIGRTTCQTTSGLASCIRLTSNAAALAATSACQMHPTSEAVHAVIGPIGTAFPWRAGWHGDNVDP